MVHSEYGLGIYRGLSEIELDKRDKEDAGEGKSEEPRKGLHFGGNRSTPDSVHQWKVVCLDLKSGKVLWEKQVHEAKPKTSIHLKNSYASETAVTDGEMVYFYFGNVGLFAYDLAGNAKWEKRFTPHKTRFGWGTAASPVLHKDRLYILNDNEEEVLMRG